MATSSFDKALYQAPQGIDSLMQDEAPFEIEIVDPEEVHIKAGDVEVDIGKGGEDDFDANLAEVLSDAALATLGGDLDHAIEQDKNSRKEWEKAYTEGLKLLGLHIEERTEPWDGACGVFHPMITEAVVRFQAEMITET